MPGLQSIERPTGDHCLKEAGDTTTCMYCIQYTLSQHIYIYICTYSESPSQLLHRRRDPELEHPKDHSWHGTVCVCGCMSLCVCAYVCMLYVCM